MNPITSKSGSTPTQQQLDAAFGQVVDEWSHPFILKAVYEHDGSLKLDLYDEQGVLQRSPSRFIKFSRHQDVKRRALGLVDKWVQTRTANPQKNSSLQYWIDIREYESQYNLAKHSDRTLKNQSEEQRICVEKFLSTDALKISAFAGTGKTTTLQHLALAMPDARGLYLAFGKAVADEASLRFPPSVRCSTTHAMAYAALNRNFPKLKLGREFGPSQVIDFLDLKDMGTGTNSIYSARQIAWWILKSLSNFQQSAAKEPLLTHVEIASGNFGDQKEAVSGFILQCVEYLWNSALSESSAVPLGFDGYLKLWCSLDRELPFDYVMLDEAQDTNEAVIQMLNRQQVKKVLVGDRYQQIYGFRGAFNAMEKLESYEEVSLTQTFRFGQPVADIANRVIQKFGEKKAIQGYSLANSVLTRKPGKTLICRSNIGLLEALLANISKRVSVVGGATRHINVVEDIQRLQAGIGAIHTPDLFGFTRWQEVERFAELPEGEELRKYANIGRNRNFQMLKAALETVEHDEGKAEMNLATAHQTKGGEWASVELANDFCSTSRLQTFAKKSARLEDSDAEELNLLYVAITRAKSSLNIPEQVLEALGSDSRRDFSDATVPPLAGSSTITKPLQPKFRSTSYGAPTFDASESSEIRGHSSVSEDKLTALKDKFNKRK